MTSPELAELPGWRHTVNPPKIDRRFTFSNYDETRTFLDRLAEQSKQDNLYPDLSFGRTHVHVTISAIDDKAIAQVEIASARHADAVAESSVKLA